MSDDRSQDRHKHRQRIFRLGPEAEADLARLREHHNLSTDAEAVRFALRLAARAAESPAPNPARKPMTK